jgi:hypothetical protein
VKSLVVLPGPTKKGSMLGRVVAGSKFARD